MPWGILLCSGNINMSMVNIVMSMGHIVMSCGILLWRGHVLGHIIMSRTMLSACACVTMCIGVCVFAVVSLDLGGDARVALGY